jgi:hypothetical protein
MFNNLVNPPLKSLRPDASVAPTFEGADEEARALLSETERDEALDSTATLPADLGQSGFDVVPPAELGVSGSLRGVSSGGVEAIRSSEERGFDVAGTARGH